MNEPENRRFLMLGSYTVAGIFMALLGFVQSFSILLIFIAGVGFSLIIYVSKACFPDVLRGRVFAVRILVSKIGMPVGALVGGSFAEGFGISTLFIFMGSLIIFVSIITFMLPVFQGLDEGDKAVIIQKQTS